MTRKYVPEPENADDTEAERFLDQMLVYGEDDTETGLQSDDDTENIPF